MIGLLFALPFYILTPFLIAYNWVCPPWYELAVSRQLRRRERVAPIGILRYAWYALRLGTMALRSCLQNGVRQTLDSTWAD